MLFLLTNTTNEVKSIKSNHSETFGLPGAFFFGSSDDLAPETLGQICPYWGSSDDLEAETFGLFPIAFRDIEADPSVSFTAEIMASVFGEEYESCDF